MKPFSLEVENKFKTVKTFVLGLIIGAVVTALYLDNRAGAMLKAFKNPVAINGMTVSVDVIKK